ncbi:hypothetical protein LRS12_16440 [Sphingomonas sp. J344]|uniref:hypothetical protein n=1 Tax=Sphingomonas sp. J344 TaxID=2898434 RepID=UPI002151773C|nr:hypothetical protein [Sphingomonas sp. J344]MCR5872157.1 hypothetical protein [Sphingomonas sp. J344]
MAFPAILYLQGSGVAAFMVALLFGVMMLVTLMYALRRANELAEPRVPLEAARAFSSSQPTWPVAIVGVGIGIDMLFDAEGVWIWVSSLFIAINVAILLSVLWRWIRARSSSAA